MYMVKYNILFIMNEGSPAGFHLLHQNTKLDKADSLFTNVESFISFGSHLDMALPPFARLVKSSMSKGAGV